jgi:hypothetical protein
MIYGMDLNPDKGLLLGMIIPYLGYKGNLSPQIINYILYPQRIVCKI